MWSRTRPELFYRGLDQRIMARPIPSTETSSGPGGLVESRRPFDVDDGKVRGGGSREPALADPEAGDAHARLPTEIASGIESPLGRRDLGGRADASLNDGGREEVDQPDDLNWRRFVNGGATGEERNAERRGHERLSIHGECGGY